MASNSKKRGQWQGGTDQEQGRPPGEAGDAHPYVGGDAGPAARPGAAPAARAIRGSPGLSAEIQARRCGARISAASYKTRSRPRSRAIPSSRHRFRVSRDPCPAFVSVTRYPCLNS